MSLYRLKKSSIKGHPVLSAVQTDKASSKPKVIHASGNEPKQYILTSDLTTSPKSQSKTRPMNVFRQDNLQKNIINAINTNGLVLNLKGELKTGDFSTSWTDPYSLSVKTDGSDVGNILEVRIKIGDKTFVLDLHGGKFVVLSKYVEPRSENPDSLHKIRYVNEDTGIVERSDYAVRRAAMKANDTRKGMPTNVVYNNAAAVRPNNFVAPDVNASIVNNEKIYASSSKPLIKEVVTLFSSYDDFKTTPDAQRKSEYSRLTDEDIANYLVNILVDYKNESSQKFLKTVWHQKISQIIAKLPHEGAKPLIREVLTLFSSYDEFKTTPDAQKKPEYSTLTDEDIANYLFNILVGYKNTNPPGFLKTIWHPEISQIIANLPNNSYSGGGRATKKRRKTKRGGAARTNKRRKSAVKSRKRGLHKNKKAKRSRKVLRRR